MKKYKSGMYGGKFMPFHKGHLLCVDRAASECEKVYLILFINGVQEQEIIETATSDDKNLLSIESRIKVIEEVSKLYSNVIPIVIDVLECRTNDNLEDWDKETPLVLEKCGKFDAVYSSEISYGPYFSRAYPYAKHVLVDPPRKIVPISATEIRNMKKNEREKWLI